MTSPTPFHRIFGHTWIDFFEGTGITVETEVDLSLKRQLLDVVIINRGNAPIPRPMPDGFEHLGPYNLVTFKSHQESLDSFALEELIGHGVNYRKQVRSPTEEMLPGSDFRLYAVCVRRPRGLGRNGALRRVRPGVYDAVWPGVRTIRVIVVHLLPLEERNAILHLFAAKSEPFLYAKDHYHPHSPEPSGLLRQLFKAYKEDPAMATLIDDFLQEEFDRLITQTSNKKKALKVMTPEERLEGLSPEERLEGLSPEDLYRGLTPDQARALREMFERRPAADDESPTSN